MIRTKIQSDIELNQESNEEFTLVRLTDSQLFHLKLAAQVDSSR